MSSILLLLQRVHQNVHQTVHTLTPKKYSKPRIYTGGVDITLWNQFSKLEQSTALSKDWYVYYKFIDDGTGKLKRMPNIKAGANKYKTKKEKLQILIPLRDALAYLLEKGLNPYSDLDLTSLSDEKTDSKQSEAPAIIKPQPEVVAFIEPKVIAIEESIMTIKEAFEFALNIKKHSLNNTSYINFEGWINRFKKSFDESQPITLVTRKLTNQYLNGILETSSSRNRNNSRIDLSPLFGVLANNEIIPDNSIKKINILKAKPERNKTYAPEM
jgi:hypothetical protein